MTKLCKPEYLEKVQHLTDEETERLLSRMGGKLPRRLAKEKISQHEALALQMELEDEHLQEWRRMRLVLKKNELDVMAQGKSNVVGKQKAAEKSKSTGEPKAAKKVKS